MEVASSNLAEKILKRRKGPNGEVEYLVRWKDLSSLENSWVTERNGNCKDLIKEFEKERKREERKNRDKIQENSSYDPVKKLLDRKSKKWCDLHKDAEVDYIIGCTKSSNGTIFYLIKWKNTELADMLTSQEARSKCPQEIIRFLEKKLVFSGQTKVFDQNG